MQNIWIFKFGLMLALLCLLLLFIGGPGLDSSRYVKQLWDLGHIFCFALWTWLYIQWRPNPEFWRQFLFLVVLSLTIGGVTELLQAQFLVDAGREGSWGDLQKDLLGCLLVLLFLAPTRRQLNRGLRHGLQLMVLLAVSWSLLPLGLVAADNVLAQRQFPLLSGFENALETGRWAGSSQRRIVNDPVYNGLSALQVQLNTDQYSGVALRHFPSDWSGYKYLTLKVYNPDVEVLNLNVRINDQRHRQFQNDFSDRFNTRFVLEHGWTTLNISLDEVAKAPKGRRMEMSRIAQVQLFTMQLSQPRTMVIDDVRLVR